MIEAVPEPPVLIASKPVAFATDGIVQRMQIRAKKGIVSPSVHIRAALPRCQAKCSVPCITQLLPNTRLSCTHVIVGKKQDSDEEIQMTLVNNGWERNKVPDWSWRKYLWIPLNKVFSCYA